MGTQLKLVALSIAAIAMVTSETIAEAQVFGVTRGYGLRGAGPFSRTYGPGAYRGGFGYGGYGGYGIDPVTGSRLGAAAMIRAQGQYNESTANAASTLETARSKYIENQVEWLKAYQERKRLGEAERNREYDQERAARDQWLAKTSGQESERLTNSEYNERTGELDWPIVFDTPRYAKAKETIDQAMVIDAYSSGAERATKQVIDLAEEMLEALKGEIAVLDPDEYISGRRFLEHLIGELKSRRG
ncbi:hypothetical protein [Stratiformator vulcanicus]|uniref:Uncharacterized protein n=1 Tax=Stratiformator vulcanicus TaxID=2527980 RepID=A0A517R1Y1_9PLAN|nr:hypothetical protein [Stratiformator vulcanicus]QDT37854.1 hypothetical protein Pan189_22360 [Stratiformator vulcanicus]